MSKTTIRVTPFGGFDIPGLESWLAAMAAKGFRFTMTTGPLSFFDRDEARTVQVHLEPIQGSTDEDPELNAIYEEAGWQYWGMFRGSFYVYVSPALAHAVYRGRVTAHRHSLETYRINWEENTSTLHPNLPNAYDYTQEEELTYPGLDGLTRFVYQFSNETHPNVVYIGLAGGSVRKEPLYETRL